MGISIGLIDFKPSSYYVVMALSTSSFGRIIRDEISTNLAVQQRKMMEDSRRRVDFGRRLETSFDEITSCLQCLSADHSDSDFRQGHDQRIRDLFISWQNITKDFKRARQDSQLIIRLASLASWMFSMEFLGEFEKREYWPQEEMRKFKSDIDKLRIPEAGRLVERFKSVADSVRKVTEEWKATCNSNSSFEYADIAWDAEDRLHEVDREIASTIELCGVPMARAGIFDLMHTICPSAWFTALRSIPHHDGGGVADMVYTRCEDRDRVFLIMEEERHKLEQSCSQARPFAKLDAMMRMHEHDMNSYVGIIAKACHVWDMMDSDISLLLEVRPKFRTGGRDDEDVLKTMKYVQSMYDAVGYALLEYES
ncbi:uncharacterized protein BT62DRAFT_362722 [Guyanagaster necrorhizus]|uniref:Uncharacterized protein n=1 Tax=Guyanagaster necrorhizus TaxID=856835 RepID=A0A9P7VM66_9AGAR|nr:uncharacterized protein BT62DRAFT_362722 [Guyanagaster necrorhizus MCA 3950]KAG7442890.1 hypothetical protein BT62DRAFT_362722 [Guyanagaster necrorhizus MCA 3950]